MGRGRHSTREEVTPRASTMIPPPPADPEVIEAMWRACLEEPPFEPDQEPQSLASSAPTVWQQAVPTWIDELAAISEAQELCA